MIYLDNAATTQKKPPEVAEAICHALLSFGDAGRGAYEASLDAGMAIHRVRQQVANLFNAPSPSRVSFSYNVTEALNIVIGGLLGRGDHAVTTAASHNSVLRPLYRKQVQEGTGLSIVPIADDGSLDYDLFDRSFTDNTRMAVVTHASNVTGDGYDVARIAEIAHAHDALLVVDTAQTAGAYPIDMQADGIDILCFTGHKSLYGPQGTGGLCVREGIEIPPFKVGGTGFHSYDHEHPKRMPESLEAGTINAHGIAGLGAGITYVTSCGIDALHDIIEARTNQLEAGLAAIPGVRIRGGHGGVFRCGIVAITIYDIDSATIADELAQEFGICTRAGAHCAPLMHESLGTVDQGVVRFSVSSFTAEDEIQAAIEAVSAIVKGCSYGS